MRLKVKFDWMFIIVGFVDSQKLRTNACAWASFLQDYNTYFRFHDHRPHICHGHRMVGPNRQIFGFNSHSSWCVFTLGHTWALVHIFHQDTRIDRYMCTTTYISTRTPHSFSHSFCFFPISETNSYLPISHHNIKYQKLIFAPYVDSRHVAQLCWVLNALKFDMYCVRVSCRGFFFLFSSSFGWCIHLLL